LNNKGDILEIMNLLPHRYPFLLVDKILEFKEGKSIICIKNVSLNEPFFNGHFPKYPVMPGVLILEALAQASGLLVFKTPKLCPPNESLYLFVGIDKARFKRPVVPGDQIELKPPRTPDKTPKPTCQDLLSLIFIFIPIRPLRDTITIAKPIEIVSSPVGYFERKSDVKKILKIIAMANNQ